jgi:pimeloyl-ACP methyl ester carboxylesterase
MVAPPGPGQADTQADGVRWRSRENPGRGEPVVFVHGLLASSATWEDVLASASAGRPAIAVDLPGFGGSERPWPYDYSVGGEARSLVAFLDARGIGRAVLVGNSLGGATAMLVAADHPARVEALVLVSSATPEARVGLPVHLMRARVLGEVALAAATRPLVAHGLRRWLFANAARVTNRVIDDAWRPLTIPGTRRAALAAVRSDRRRYLGLEARVRVPTLIVWGRQDRLIPVAEAAKLQSRIAGSRLIVLDDAGHLPQREQPDAFSNAVAGFVTGLTARSAR